MPFELVDACRRIVRAPFVPVFIVLTLGLAIGANAVIFTFIHQLLLAPLPMAEPDRVVLVLAENASLRVGRSPSSLSEFLEWREASQSFEELAAGDRISMSLRDERGVSHVEVRRVTVNFFDAWGLTPALGGGFRSGEGGSAAPPGAILSDGFWKRRFGADPGIVGRRIVLDGQEYVVRGVLPPKVEIGDLARTDLWVLLPTRLDAATRATRTFVVTGLLRPGLSVAEAEAELAAIQSRVAAEYPESSGGWSVRVRSFRDAMAVPETWQLLSITAAAVAMVLLSACANVGSVLLTRLLDRRRDVVVRLALGATRSRIVRGLLIEAFLLAMGGGLIGVAIAHAGLGLTRATTFHPFFDRVGLDGPVLAFVVAISGATPFLFALGPVLGSSRASFADAMRRVAARTSDRGATLRSLAVVTQVCVAFVLLLACLQTVRAASALRFAETGFESQGRRIARVRLPDAAYRDGAAVARFVERALERIRGASGGAEVGATSLVPLLDSELRETLRLDAVTASETPWAVPVSVSDRYLETMGIELITGRSLSAASGRSAVVSRAFALRYLGGVERALGDELRLESASYRVVGVVEDVRGALSDAAPKPYVYVSFEWRPVREVAFVLYDLADGSEHASLTRLVQELDPELAVHDERSFAEALDEHLANDRLVARFFSAFAIVTSLLAVTGLYGLIAYAVETRRFELSLRAALGAGPRQITRLVVRRAAELTLLGVGLGTVATLLFARAGEVLGAGAPLGIALYLAAALGFVLVAVAAGYGPARIAARRDPAVDLSTV